MTMKMTKKDLKNMMRECILELIKEGAFNGTHAMMPSSSTQNSNIMPMHMLQNPTAATMMREQQQNNSAEMEMMAKQVAANAAAAFSNPALKSKYQHLFEDTILNTLPQQSMLNEQYTEMEAKQDFQKLNAIPGVDVSRLAKIAFAGGSRKKLPGMRTADDDDNG